MTDEKETFWCHVCDREYTVDELKKSNCPVCGRHVDVKLRAAEDFDNGNRDGKD